MLVVESSYNICKPDVYGLPSNSDQLNLTHEREASSDFTTEVISIVLSVSGILCLGNR